MTEKTHAHLLDMASITLTHDPETGIAQALTSEGHLLAAIRTDNAPTPADQACQLLDAILEKGTILAINPNDPQQRIAHKIALYNPFTQDIAVNALPLTERLTANQNIPLPKSGIPIELSQTETGNTKATIPTPGGPITAVAATRTVNELTRLVATLT